MAQRQRVLRMILSIHSERLGHFWHPFRDGSRELVVAGLAPLAASAPPKCCISRIVALSALLAGRTDESSLVEGGVRSETGAPLGIAMLWRRTRRRRLALAHGLMQVVCLRGLFRIFSRGIIVRLGFVLVIWEISVVTTTNRERRDTRWLRIGEFRLESQTSALRLRSSFAWECDNSWRTRLRTRTSFFEEFRPGTSQDLLAKLPGSSPVASRAALWHTDVPAIGDIKART